jgi:hypothetical protein
MANLVKAGDAKPMGLPSRKVTMIARPPKIILSDARFAASLDLPRLAVFFQDHPSSILSFDKGKPGESRGRKANGSIVTQSDHDCQATENDMNAQINQNRFHVDSVHTVSGALIGKRFLWHPRQIPNASL